ncbi:SusC/RagA family TonB-linked outer membrane protein [Winogradskyella bathintestinalis]|uniref:SusC/RagA family TonB-linked outer membrane protein n=1 Tax=Winogradskyella bathintestinalis TaxID=3035208 RepID=A0ABT7ZXR8_9FLAO|nr:SusC/RagA family TonB-linked outer membrane protein [Winogradskyella bathintestinalis]MDN3493802.1 SusC/RagA family TonB-linked outer membrane protein [Winogradskyella bathintestinalis]
MKLKLTWLLTLFIAFVMQFSFAQQQTVTGTVTTASDGLPLPGVNVIVKGTSKGTQTDFDGKYSISAATGEIISFSYIGFAKQSITVADNTTIDVAMQEDAESLDAVVVTGYQDIKKALFTGASQTVKAADIKLDGVPDISQALEGRAAGVAVQNVTGTFGAAPRITIRGSSSILGDTKPLWIVDGVIQESIVDVSFADLVSGDPNTILSSALSGLNPTDINSFEILKDASATALYGARALNGVIVITTKSGKKNQKPQFNYSGEFLVRDRPRYSQYNLLNSQETVSVYEEMHNKGFLRYPDVLNLRNGGVYNIRAQAINSYDESNGAFGIPNTAEDRAAFLQTYEMNNTDWFKELFRMTPTQTHNISFSSGSENSTTYASLGYYTDAGWSIAERVRRLTSNLRNTFYLADSKLKITTFLSANVRDQKAPGAQTRNNDPFFGSFNRDFDINPFSYALSTSRALRPRDNNGNLEYYRANWAPFNIVNEIENNTLEQNVTDVKFQLQTDYNITDDLKYTFLGSARYATSNGELAARENSNVVSAYRADENTIVQNANIFLFTDPDQPNAIPRSVLETGGILTETTNTLTTYTFRNSLNYSKTFNDVHGINLYANQEYRHIDRSASSFTGYGYQFNRGGSIFTDPDILRKVILEGNDYFFSQETRSREVSFAMTASYDYDNKYILNLTGNYEGSNRAGQSSSARWIPTYSIGGRWNVHEESFLEDSDAISSLVVRPSYGVIGLIPSNASNNLAIFRNQITDRLNPDDRENFIDIEDLENSDLTYELTKEVNLGIELGLFDQRIQIVTDLYSRKGIDLIDLVRTSGIGGQVTKLGNNSEMTTRGLEFQLNTVNIDTEDFQWRTGFNISFIDQEITAIRQRPRAFDFVSGLGLGNAVGYAPNALFSYRFTGLDEFGVPGFDLGEGANSNNGVNFQDTDEPLSYLVYDGPSLPTTTGGFSNNFKYKNWNLSAFISFSAGNKIRLDPAYSSTYNDLSVFPSEFTNRWVLPGDEATTNIPVIPSRQLLLSYGNTNMSQIYNAYNYSDQRIADGGFVRMKNISIGYNFDRSLIEGLGLTSMRMSLQGTNLFLIYSDSKLGGQDPEFFNTGGVASPITRQFTFSFNVGF